LEGFETGIDREDKSTWKASNWPHNSHGIIQHYALGQEQFVWDMRMEESVINIFAQIWGTRKLLVSFDGANLSRPSQINRPDKKWEHVDQGPKKLGFQCIQGSVNLLDCGEEDGGLVVYDGSHKLHTAFFEAHTEAKHGDWYLFCREKGELDFYASCKQIKVCAKAGDMILWDSRTVHYATRPTGKRNRSVIYICMTPAEWAHETAIKKKKKAFADKRMTTHWPHCPILFPVKPRSYGKKEVETHFPVSRKLATLNSTGKRLAGLLPYD